MERNITEGWMLRKLGELFSIEKEQISIDDPLFNKLLFIGLENIEANSRRYIANKDNSREGQSTSFLFDDKHLLYGRLRPYLNKVYLPNKQGRCSMEFLPLKPNPGFAREFIAFILQSRSVVDYATKHSTGGRMPRANMNDLIKLEVSVPNHQSEQNAIVRELESKMAEVEIMRQAAMRQKEAAEAIRGAILRNVFTSNGKKDAWRTVKIAKIAHIKMGQSPDGSTYNQEGYGTPLLNGPTEFGAEHPTPVQWTTAPKKICEKGDLILCVRGNTTGRMNKADQEYCLGRGVAGIRGRERKGNTDFLAYALQFKIGQLLVGSERSTFPNLGRDELNSFKVLAPEDETQQSKIANEIKDKLNAVDGITNKIDSQLEAIQALPSAILREVFDFQEANA